MKLAIGCAVQWKVAITHPALPPWLGVRAQNNKVSPPTQTLKGCLSMQDLTLETPAMPTSRNGFLDPRGASRKGFTCSAVQREPG